MEFSLLFTIYLLGEINLLLWFSDWFGLMFFYLRGEACAFGISTLAAQWSSYFTGSFGQWSSGFFGEYFLAGGELTRLGDV